MTPSVPSTGCRAGLYAGRALALLWAAFWTWFGIASGMGEGLSLGGILLHALVPGLLFLAFALLVWKWQTVGAWILLVTGLLVGISYPFWTNSRFPLATIIFVELTIAVPPLAAGLLLLLSRPRPDSNVLPAA